MGLFSSAIVFSGILIVLMIAGLFRFVTSIELFMLPLQSHERLGIVVNKFRFRSITQCSFRHFTVVNNKWCSCWYYQLFAVYQAFAGPPQYHNNDCSCLCHSLVDQGHCNKETYVTLFNLSLKRRVRLIESHLKGTTTTNDMQNNYDSLFAQPFCSETILCLQKCLSLNSKRISSRHARCKMAR